MRFLRDANAARIHLESTMSNEMRVNDNAWNTMMNRLAKCNQRDELVYITRLHNINRRRDEIIRESQDTQ